MDKEDRHNVLFVALFLFSFFIALMFWRVYSPKEAPQYTYHVFYGYDCEMGSIELVTHTKMKNQVKVDVIQKELERTVGKRVTIMGWKELSDND